ncbi:MAG: hypothetical protein HWD61_01130 [Parachlamydiaceae bacterium]|nr:MAG: hypothetical protein HWD61_01130 [Parachlamydiaceae bacterium]
MQKYKKQGYETKALETLGRIIKHGRLIDLEWKSIAEEYWKENNYENTLSAIQRSGLKRVACGNLISLKIFQKNHSQKALNAFSFGGTNFNTF